MADDTIPSHVQNAVDVARAGEKNFETLGSILLIHLKLLQTPGAYDLFLEDSERHRFADYEEYLDSNVWHQKRCRVLDRAHHCCERCAAEHTSLEVHHLRYPEIWGEEELGDLLALCPVCHDVVHEVSDEG